MCLLFDIQMVIQATGILSEWEWPVIPGIKNFKGTIMHTADWDNALDSKTWDGKRVAVIGNGASGIQVITFVVLPLPFASSHGF